MSNLVVLEGFQGLGFKAVLIINLLSCSLLVRVYSALYLIILLEDPVASIGVF